MHEVPDVGLDPALLAVQGHFEKSARERALEAQKRRSPLGVGGIGRDRPLIAGLVRPTEAREAQEAPALSCGGERAASPPPLVSAVVAEPQGASGRLFRSQEIGGSPSGQHHDAAQGVAAVRCGRRPAQDLDRAQQLGLHQVAAGVGETAHREPFGDRHAVNLDRHPVAIDAADAEAVRPEAPGAPDDGDRRLVADEVLESLGLSPVELLPVDDGRGARDLPHRPFDLASDHRHRVEDRRCSPLFLRLGRCPGPLHRLRRSRFARFDGLRLRARGRESRQPEEDEPPHRASTDRLPKRTRRTPPADVGRNGQRGDGTGPRNRGSTRRADR